MIEVKGLSHQFDSRWVLKDINLTVEQGEIVAIMGSSGGGKTTLLRCISGLIHATEGCVTVDEVDVAKQPEEARLRMGMVFQSAAMFDFLNVKDNVLFGVKRHSHVGHEEQDKVVVEALKMVGLHDIEHQMPSELSGGMKKRVGIARAIALKPKIMLYDEPTTGLDPVTAYTIDALIVNLQDTLHVTSLLVSHDVSSVYRVADRIAFLHAGHLIFQGTPAEFGEAKEESIQDLVQKAYAKDLRVPIKADD